MKGRGGKKTKKKLFNKNSKSTPEMKLTVPAGMEGKEPFLMHRVCRGDPMCLILREGKTGNLSKVALLVNAETRATVLVLNPRIHIFIIRAI